MSDYLVYQKMGPKQFDAYKARPATEKAVQDFRDALAGIATPEEFVQHRKALSFVMQAFGLGLSGDPTELGISRRAVVQDLTDPKAIGNVLKDTRYKDMTAALDFANSGVAKLSDPAVVEDIVTRYQRSGFETEIGQKVSALRDVIVFRRQVGGISRTMDILANPILRRVVTTGLQLPTQIVNQSLEKNVADIDRRIDTTRFMLASSNAAGANEATAAARLQVATADAALATLDATTAKLDGMVGGLKALQADYARLDATYAANAAERSRQQANLPMAVDAYRDYVGAIGTLQVNSGQLTYALNTLQTAQTRLAAGDTAGATTAMQTAGSILSQRSTALATLVSSDGTALAVTDQPADRFDASGTYVSKTVSITGSVSASVRVYDLAPALAQVNQAVAAGAGGGGLRSQIDAMMAAATQGKASIDQARAGLGRDYAAFQSAMGALAGDGVAISSPGLSSVNGLATAGKTAIEALQAAVERMELLAVAAAEPGYAGDRGADQTSLAALADSLGSALAKGDYKDAGTGTTRSLLREAQRFVYEAPRYGSASYAIDAVPLQGSLDAFAVNIRDAANGLATVAGGSNALAAIRAFRSRLDGVATTINAQVAATSISTGASAPNLGGAAIPLNTASLSAAKGLAAAGKAATEAVLAKIEQMRVLVAAGADPAYAGDRAADQSALGFLAIDLGTALVRSNFADPASGTTRSLLRGSQRYSYDLARDGSSTLGMNAIPLEDKINAFAQTMVDGTNTLATAAGASSTLAAILAFRPEVEQAASAMNGQVQATTAALALDPRAGLDTRYGALVTSVAAEMAKPVNNPLLGDVQLLGADAESLALLQLDESYGLKLQAQTQLTADLARALGTGAGALAGTASFDTTSAPWTALSNAVTGLGDAKSQLLLNRDAIATKRTSVLADNPDAAAPIEEGNKTADPFDVQTTEFTEQFVKRYLAAVDSANTGTSQGSGRYQAALDVMNGTSKPGGFLI